MGQTPVQDAYEQLRDLAPDLGRVRQTLIKDNKRNAYPRLRELTTSVGPDSGHADQLVRSTLALNVAMQYLIVLSGDRRRGDIETPYFETARRPMISGMGGRSRSGDP